MPFLKSKVGLLGLLCLLVVALGLFVLQSRPEFEFNAIADDYIDHFYLPTNPSLATSLGIHRYDGQIEDFSAHAINHNIQELQKYAARLKALNPRRLSEQKQADRELLLSNIYSQLLTLQKIQFYKKNPDLYSSTITNAAFVIMERKFADLDERLRSLIAREKQMPQLLAEARKNVDNPPRIYTQIALEQLPGMIRFFQVDLPKTFEKVNDEALQKQFAESNAAVIQSLQAYQKWLKNTLLPRSHGDFRLGEETFRLKLLYDEMVDLPLSELIRIGMADLRKNQQEFARVAREIDPTKTTQEVLHDLAKDHPAPEHLLATFNDSLAYLVQFIQRKQIITLPSKIMPTLEETPPFLRAITFASMDIPGPFENTATEAYFNVTLPEKTWSKEKTQEFMAQFNYPGIYSVSVHEAYPGHYVQFLWLKENKDRARKIFGATSNAEGWAHYCEQMMSDEGLGQDKGNKKAKLLRLGYLQEALLRNARYIVSIKMHTGQMSYQQAQDFFVQQGHQTKAVALVEAKRGTVDPTYLYYTLGKLEILKLRADLEKKQGAAFKLKDFHNEFMKQGYPPIKIVRKALLGDNSPVL